MNLPGAAAPVPAAKPRPVICEAFDKVARTPIRLTRLDERGRRLPPECSAVGIGTVETTTVPMPPWDAGLMAEAYGRPCTVAFSPPCTLVFSPRLNTVILMNIRVASGPARTCDRREALQAYAAMTSAVTSAAMPASWFVEAYSTHPELGTWGVAMPRVEGAVKISVSATQDTHVIAHLRGNNRRNRTVFPVEGFPTADVDTLMVVTSSLTEMPGWAARVLEDEPECSCCP